MAFHTFSAPMILASGKLVRTKSIDRYYKYIKKGRNILHTEKYELGKNNIELTLSLYDYWGGSWNHKRALLSTQIKLNDSIYKVVPGIEVNITKDDRLSHLSVKRSATKIKRIIKNNLTDKRKFKVATCNICNKILYKHADTLYEPYSVSTCSIKCMNVFDIAPKIKKSITYKKNTCVNLRCTVAYAHYTKKGSNPNTIRIHRRYFREYGVALSSHPLICSTSCR